MTSRSAQVIAAAIDAGHELEIDRSNPKRFRIVCPCGWASSTTWTRKHAFQAAKEHFVAAGVEVLDGVSLPDLARADL